MARGRSEHASVEEAEPLTSKDSDETAASDTVEGRDSVNSISTTSLVLEGLNAIPQRFKPTHKFDYQDGGEDDGVDLELPRYMRPVPKKMSRDTRLLVWLVSAVALIGWALALFVFLVSGRYRHPSTIPFSHDAPSKNSGKKITWSQVEAGQWAPIHQQISWIGGAHDEDGLLLEHNQPGKEFLVIEDVRSRSNHPNALASQTLMKSGWFEADGGFVWADDIWPSPDLKHVLIVAKREKNFRHSFTGNYYIFDVDTQTAQHLDPGNPGERIQLASWAPTSDAIVFTRGNNLFLRIIPSTAVRQITSDGGPEYFYGVPDWVYEEEVLQGNSATWWDLDGQYIAFLRTNETLVPEYPVQYFVSRPSGHKPPPGEEHYPEVLQIKYPKAGAPNPVVDLQFYDVNRAEVFSVDIEGGFADDDRLIIEVLPARGGKILVREANRESDTFRVVLVDATTRTGTVVRKQDVAALDGGWVEPAQTSMFIPADPANGRPDDGYIDTVIHNNYDHLAYFSPLDSANPVMLTKGEWEVVQAPSAVDLKNNLVYFSATKEGSTQRHIYSVKLDGTDMKPMVPTDKPGYYFVSFSSRAGYALVNYEGPDIPSQKVMSTPSNPDIYDEIVEENSALAQMAATHEVPHKVFSSVTIDNVTLNVVEIRPAHFDESKEYPVLFHLYGGPGSQTVDRRFRVDFQSVVASSLGYLVVTLDGRGTGFIGRKARAIIRDNLGHYEALDQIYVARAYADKSYVDASRMAIWGWSYGGFMTLKTLELDGGATFQYGMAVAPVTDWRFYDSVYTERYMHTPQANAAGYASSAISNVTALRQTVRFMIMHGVADDNVHMQNTLTLLDKLDLAGVENYDVHVFPDSDHGIYFHNANRIVYDKLTNWLVNAFNGEWYRTEDPSPQDSGQSAGPWTGALHRRLSTAGRGADDRDS